MSLDSRVSLLNHLLKSLPSCVFVLYFNTVQEPILYFLQILVQFLNDLTELSQVIDTNHARVLLMLPDPFICSFTFLVGEASIFVHIDAQELFAVFLEPTRLIRVQHKFFDLGELIKLIDRVLIPIQ